MQVEKSINNLGGLTTYSIKTNNFGVSVILHHGKWHKRIKITRSQIILPFGALEWFSFNTSSFDQEAINEDSV